MDELNDRDVIKAFVQSKLNNISEDSISPETFKLAYFEILNFIQELELNEKRKPS